MADILLEVGISIASLKTARAQIGAELKSWKFPETEKVMPIDAKQLSDSKKFAVELRKEFEKLGTAIGKGDIVNISRAYAPLEKTGDAASFSSANLKKLAETSKFYNLQASVQGETLSSVRAELSAYNRALAHGSVTMQQVGHRYTELSVKFNELSEQQNKVTQGLLGGINLPRLLLWAVGWTVIYSAIREVLNILGEVGTTIVKVNEVIETVRVANLETAKSFDQTYASIRGTIYNTARDSLIAAKDLAAAYKTLTFEGAKGALATEALVHVRELMTITGEKENVISQALIETYGLFKDKILGATTESEKLGRITDLLATLFTRAHVSISEYQQIMSFIGATAVDVVPSFDYLVRLLVYADNAMLQGRRAGMALMQVLVGLTEDTKKLQELGIFIKYGEAIDVLKVLKLIKEQTAGLNEEAKKDLLKKMFKGQALALVLKVLQEIDLTLSSITANTEKLGKAQEDAMKKSHFLAVGLKNIVTSIGYGLSESWSWLTKILAADAERHRAYEEHLMATGRLSKDAAYIEKESTTTLEKAVAAAKLAREEAAKRKVTTEEMLIVVKKSREETDKEAIAAIKIIGIERNKLDLISRALELRKLEAVGAAATLIVQEKLETAIIKAVGAIENQEERAAAINAIRKAQYGDIETLAKTILYYTKDQQATDQAVNDIIEARSAIQIKMLEEIKSLADEIESKTVDFVKSMMTGTANVKDFFQSIVDLYKETFAKEVVRMFEVKTGLFTGMAAAFMSPLQRGIYDGSVEGSKMFYDAIIAASSNAAYPGKTAGGILNIFGGGAGAGGGAGGGKNLLDTFFSSISGIFGGGIAKAKTSALSKQFQQQQTDMLSDVFKGSAAFGGKAISATELQQGVKTAQQQTGMLSKVTSAIGAGLSMVASVYGGVQSIMAQKGQGAGMGALGGALGGAMAGTAILPGIGTVIGGIIGGIGGLIMGSKKQKIPDEVKTQTIELKSAISISNKELQLVNRNLEGIKRAFEGMWMPRSAYFSERLGVEERFNLDRQRGL